MPQDSRAEYYKERRRKYKLFSVEIERETMSQFERELERKGETKANWLKKKIKEELSEE